MARNGAVLRVLGRILAVPSHEQGVGWHVKSAIRRRRAAGGVVRQCVGSDSGRFRMFVPALSIVINANARQISSTSTAISPMPPAKLNRRPS